MKIYIEKMYILSVIKYGLGNKLFMLVYFMYLYKNLENVNKIYIVQKKSIFENQVIDLFHIFPNLKKLSWLVFINWDIYDKLKINTISINTKSENYSLRLLQNQKKSIELTGNFNVTFDSVYFKNYMKKYFIFSSSIKNKITLKNNVDQTILIHIRLGDKLSMIYNNIVKKNKNYYIVSVFTPEFYKHCVKKILKENNNIKYIYIFTDSKKIVQKHYIPVFQLAFKNLSIRIFENEYNNYEIIYIFSVFKYIILSDSTLTYFGTYLSQLKEKNIWCHRYSVISLNKDDYVINKLNKNDKNYNLIKNKCYFLSNRPKLLNEMVNMR